MKKTLLLLLYLFIGKSFAQIQNPPFSTAGNQVAVPLNTSPLNYGYHEYLPANFNATSGQKYPVVLFFHGAGEKGNGTTDLNKILAAGLPKLLNSNTLDLPGIVISPQSSIGEFYEGQINEIYNYIVTKYPVDLNRFYVTGLSIGGGNTWLALDKIASKIAAAVPICGYGNVTNPSPSLRSMPIWAFHNFTDPTVPSYKTINNCDYIANIPTSCMSVYPYGPANTVSPNHQTLQFNTTTLAWSNVTGVVAPTDKLAYTVYSANSHDAWSATYANAAVYTWLFAQSKGTLGTDDFDLKNQYTVYPNPTGGVVNLSENLQNKTITIYNTLGQQVKAIANSNAIIDLSELNSGIYFLNSKDNNDKVRIIKIVKE
jgi:dienelactone hydrolase